MTPRSVFTDYQFFLILIIGALTLDSLQLVQRVENANRTEVSEWLIAILVLKNLCDAGIALGFGDSLHSLSTCSYPGMQVVLVMALGIGSIACSLSMTAEVLPLDLGLLPSNQIASLAPGSIFVISGLCRTKFDTNFRMAVG